MKRKMRKRPTGKIPKESPRAKEKAVARSISFPPDFLEIVDNVCEHVDRSRSNLIVSALKYYFKNKLSEELEELEIELWMGLR